MRTYWGYYCGDFYIYNMLFDKIWICVKIIKIYLFVFFLALGNNNIIQSDNINK